MSGPIWRDGRSLDWEWKAEIVRIRRRLGKGVTWQVRKGRVGKREKRDINRDRKMPRQPRDLKGMSCDCVSR